jgi:hypothetical protein
MAKRSKTTWAFLAITSLLAVWALVLVRREPQSASTPGPSASSSLVRAEDLVVDPASAALVGGLRAGAIVVGDWRVLGITAVRDGRITISLDRDRDVGMSVWIGRKAEKRPPIETARYAITYGDVRPEGRSVPESEQSSVAKAIEAKVRESEASAPTPPGL